MKVLQVNCVYKKGSTGKITYDLHRGLLADGIESIVCYGRGELVDEPGVYKVCPEWYSKLNNALTRITGVMYSGCNFSTNKLISIIKKEKPDIVHLQCINGYFVNIYRLVKWLKATRIRTVVTLHAEFMYTGGCGHSINCNQWSTREGCGHSTKCPRWRSETGSLLFDGTGKMWREMKDAFEGFDENLLVTSVSPWLMERAKHSPILEGKEHCVVFNGLDTNVFHPYNTEDLRRNHECENRKVVFHATPSFSDNPNHIKGGYYLLELAKIMPDVRFIVAGNYTSNMQIPENVTLLGTIKDQKLLARYYAMADVTLLTSKRETFSMVTAESLCCGTPVVGFKAGAPEQIAIKKYSEFVEFGDLEKLQDTLRTFLEKERDIEIASIAQERYSTETMLHNYRKCYEKIICGGKNG